MSYKTSSKIRIENDIIYLDYCSEKFLQITLDEIFIIGEYTTPEGPNFDEWFFVFVNQKGSWKRISCYVENFQSLLDFLAEKFHEDLVNVSLANSANWKTVVRYPDSLKGKSLFKLVENKNQQSLFDKIKSIFIGRSKSIELSDEVADSINHGSR